MFKSQRCRFFAIIILAISIQGAATALAEEWSIPLGGNAFPAKPGQDGVVGRGGNVTLQSNERCVVYFRTNQPAVLQFALRGKARGAEEAEADVSVRFGAAESVAKFGDQPTTVALDPLQTKEVSGGYHRLDLRCAKEAEASAELTHVVVSSETESLELDFVRNNKGNMFYWGRRGPSVHLRYEVPNSPALRYAYTEITVPEGMDPIGSYYMANGFGEGYFGMQVNNAKERRVLFSVWSPFKTDNPRDVPREQRIEMLARGEKVHTGKFGNEGSGGQSYLVYPWKAGKTYQFLTEVIPDGEGKTTYTSWFGDKSANEWQLIASFRRPKTNKNLTGFHSFLESFSPNYGNIERRAQWGNVWVRDVEANWHECKRARFSVDATGGGRHRLDFEGGSNGTHFFMRNCGFFNESGKAGEVFERESTEGDRPKIDFEKLPRS